jgi:hypothetical protein
MLVLHEVHVELVVHVGQSGGQAVQEPLLATVLAGHEVWHR